MSPSCKGCDRERCTWCDDCADGERIKIERDALNGLVTIAESLAAGAEHDRDEALRLLAEARAALEGRERVLQSNIEDLRADRDFARDGRIAAESRNAALVGALREQVERVGEVHGLNCLCGNEALHRVRNHLRAALEASPAPVEKKPCEHGAIIHPDGTIECPWCGEKTTLSPAPVRMVSLERVEAAMEHALQHTPIDEGVAIIDAVLAKLAEVKP